jgi:hypothetical protein
VTTQAHAAATVAGDEVDVEVDVEAAATEPVVAVKQQQDAGKRYSEVLLALSQLATAGFVTPLPQVHTALALHAVVCACVMLV